MVDVEQLARGVIRQALVDAGVGTEDGKRLSINDANRNAARSFLTASAGSWKAAREFWASAADLDAEKLRRGTMKLLGIEAPDPALRSEEPLRLFYPVDKPPKVVRKRVEGPSEPKPGTKLRTVFDLLCRPEGVSVEELAERFGWNRATCGVKIGDLRRFGVSGRRNHDGRYHLVRLA